MNVINLDDIFQDSEELRVGDNYSLVHVMPSMLVGEVLISYVIVNRSNGAYEWAGPALPEARVAFDSLERSSKREELEEDPLFLFEETETCH